LKYSNGHSEVSNAEVTAAEAAKFFTDYIKKASNALD
jgi:hypothetical protein